MESYIVPKKSCRLCTFFFKCKLIYSLPFDIISWIKYVWDILQINKQIHARPEIICLAIKNIFQYKLYVNVIPYSRLSLACTISKEFQGIVFSWYNQSFTQITQWLWRINVSKLRKLYHRKKKVTSYTLGIIVKKIKILFVGSSINDSKVKNFRLQQLRRQHKKSFP